MVRPAQNRGPAGGVPEALGGVGGAGGAVRLNGGTHSLGSVQTRCMSRVEPPAPAGNPKYLHAAARGCPARPMVRVAIGFIGAL